MNFIRKHKKVSIAVLCVLVITVLIFSIYGRYIRNILHNYILETKAFYFNSSILQVNGKHYSITNWDGVNSYPLTIDLNNRKTEGVHTKGDIVYDISYDCPDTVVCTLSKAHGVIHPDDETDSYELLITPLQRFTEEDELVISTSVESTSPYRKTMSATYTIGVEKSNFAYEIVDSVNANYLTINFTNAISFYEVSEAFGDYDLEETVSLEDYHSLTTAEQDKCFSAIVTIEYDPRILFVDMTNKHYLGRLPSSYQEETIGGYQWVSGFSFKVNASSSASIIFYKNDPTQNYSYPNQSNTSIIDVSVVLADESS